MGIYWTKAIMYIDAGIHLHVHVYSEGTGYIHVHQSDLEVVIHPECLVKSEQAEG